MSKKIIAYHVVAWRTTQEFNKRVNEKIDEGFQPYGDMTIVQPVAITDYKSKDLIESDTMYTQAMVMYSDLKD